MTEALTRARNRALPVDSSGFSHVRRRFAQVISRFMVPIVIAIGCAIRLRIFFFNRPLWLDEALLSNELISRSFGDLLTMPSETQVAPLGYMAIAKVTINMFGVGEQALRAPALMAGLAALFIALPISRRALSGRLPRLVFVSLVAFAPGLIYYSTEAKQYSFDVAATLLIYWLALRYSQDRKGLRALAVAGSAVVWFSHGSVFVVAGVGIWLGMRWLQRREPRKIVGVVALWVSQIIAMRLVTRMSAELAGYVSEYWMPYFAPLPPRSSVEVRWYADSLASIFSYSFTGSAPGYWHGTPNTLPLTGAVVVGAGVAFIIATVATRRHALPTVLGAAAGLPLLASGLGLYPFGARAALFLVPIVFLAVSLVLDLHLSLASGFMTKVASALSTLVLILIVAGSAQDIATPEPGSDIRSTIDYVLEHQQPGDLVIVSDQTEAAYEYYRVRDDLAVPPRVGVLDQPYESGRLLNEFGGSDRARVWLLFNQRVEEVPPLMSDLSSDSRLRDWHAASGSVVLLTDLSEGDDA